jgi:hypothetical protein
MSHGRKLLCFENQRSVCLLCWLMSRSAKQSESFVATRNYTNLWRNNRKLQLKRSRCHTALHKKAKCIRRGGCDKNSSKHFCVKPDQRLKLLLKITLSPFTICLLACLLRRDACRFVGLEAQEESGSKKEAGANRLATVARNVAQVSERKTLLLHGLFQGKFFFLKSERNVLEWFVLSVCLFEGCSGQAVGLTLLT